MIYVYQRHIICIYVCHREKCSRRSEIERRTESETETEGETCSCMRARVTDLGCIHVYHMIYLYDIHAYMLHNMHICISERETCSCARARITDLGCIGGGWYQGTRVSRSWRRMCASSAGSHANVFCHTCTREHSEKSVCCMIVWWRRMCASSAGLSANVLCQNKNKSTF
jgi:hypothetical protein